MFFPAYPDDSCPAGIHFSTLPGVLLKRSRKFRCQSSSVTNPHNTSPWSASPRRCLFDKFAYAFSFAETPGSKSIISDEIQVSSQSSYLAEPASYRHPESHLAAVYHFAWENAGGKLLDQNLVLTAYLEFLLLAVFACSTPRYDSQGKAPVLLPRLPWSFGLSRSRSAGRYVRRSKSRILLQGGSGPWPGSDDKFRAEPPIQNWQCQRARGHRVSRIVAPSMTLRSRSSLTSKSLTRRRIRNRFEDAIECSSAAGGRQPTVEANMGIW